jgi:hypothetical protein
VTSPAAQFADAGLTTGATYLYRVRAFDGTGRRSADSNYDIATAIAFADVLSPATPVRAKHIVQVRQAANAICTYAGAALCPTLPFSGVALDETHMRTQWITQADFAQVRNSISSLRSAIGAAAATFHDAPAAGAIIRSIHMEDLREGAN